MNYQLFVVLGIMAAGAVILYFVWYKPKQAKKQGKIQKNCPSTHVATTVYNICLPAETKADVSNVYRKDGGWVIAEGGIPDQATKDKLGETVVRGLQRMIRAATAANPTWTNWTDTGKYNVWMIKKQATNMDGTPALLVGPQKIQAAATVINIHNDLVYRAAPVIVVPQPDDFNAPGYWAYLEASVYNEGEHIIEYMNDQTIFLQKNQGINDIHPHWPPVDESDPHWPPVDESAMGLVAARALPALPAVPSAVVDLGDPRDPVYRPEIW